MALGVCIADPGGLVGLLYSSAAWPMPAPAIAKTIADAVASMSFLMDFTPSRRAVSSHAQIRTLFSLPRFRVMGSAPLTLDRVHGLGRRVRTGTFLPMTPTRLQYSMQWRRIG